VQAVCAAGIDLKMGRGAAFFHGLAKQAFGQRAAANVAQADKKDLRFWVHDSMEIREYNSLLSKLAKFASFDNSARNVLIINGRIFAHRAKSPRILRNTLRKSRPIPGPLR
jgi:hypothetical protein